MNIQDLEFSLWKSSDRSRVVLIRPDGTEVSAGALIDASNRLARSLRALGCQPGDGVAMVLGNDLPVFELMLAISQSGLYLVPINWHLTGAEIAHIVEDSEARVLICDPRFAGACADLPVKRFCTGDHPGFAPYAELLQGSSAPLENRLAGGVMNYTSGTTGKPKGVRRPLPPVPPEPVVTGYALFLLMFGMKPGVGVQLVGSPLYHTAVLYFSSSALHLGHKLVVMDKWTPQGFLERVQTHRVTTSHMVPTQFSRLLALANHRRYDVSSLKNMVHSAAPCPVPIKQQMLDWWGPVIYEYYAATEGGGTVVSAAEWIERPGTVGKPWQGADIAICDDDGQRLPANEIGTVYIAMQQGFEYHRDRSKTDRAHNTEGYFTVGDVGYLDAEGYLFLCDRKADMIISGGVNIYPAEIEAVLITHPAVVDVAVFGIPNADWGEEVKAVIEPVVGLTGTEALAAEILAFSADRLARYKCPRSIDFVVEMPRDPNGKLAKRKLRDPHWQDMGRAI